MPKPTTDLTQNEITTKLDDLRDQLENVESENDREKRRGRTDIDFTEQNELREEIETLESMLTTETRFFAALRELERRFPMCHIEAWTPGEYAETEDGKTPDGLDWSDPLWAEVTYKLHKWQDAATGCCRDTVRDAVESARKPN